MEKFEQKVLVTYLLKFLEFGVGYDEDFCKKLLAGKSFFRDKLCKLDLFEDSQKQNILKSFFADEILSYEGVETSCFQNKLDNYYEVFKFGKEEIDFLNFFIRLNIFHEYKFFIKTGTEDYDTLDYSFLEMDKYKIYCVRRKLNAKKVLDADKLSFDLQRMLMMDEIHSKEDMSNFILGAKLQTDLNWTDFEYLKKDRDIIAKIIKNAIKTQKCGVNILFYGKEGTGKTELAKLVGKKLEINVYGIKNRNTFDFESGRDSRLNDLKFKQTLLENTSSYILFDEANDVLNFDASPRADMCKSFLNEKLETNPIPIIWTTNDINLMEKAFLRRMTYAIKFEELDETTRLGIWKKSLRTNNIKLSKENVIRLNKNYKAAPELIENAVQTTKMIDGSVIEIEKFLEARTNLLKTRECKKISKVKEIETNSDFIIEFCNPSINLQHLTKQIVTSKKLNFSMCIYGEPGTGKSLFAKYLAQKLGLKTIQKRGSDLLSCLVGGTESNIAAAFKEAAKEKAFLIFDEADSFLQSRQLAHHSWEITGVNEMLTWMESHQYPFLCTTNNLDILDEACLRRFTFKIAFDFMSAEQVKSAFEYFFGLKIPKENDLDIQGLTAGDFATVRNKAHFLNIKSFDELTNMLNEEASIKKSKVLKSKVGF